MMRRISTASGSEPVSIKDRLRWNRSLPLAVLLSLCFPHSPGFSRKIDPQPPAASYGEATQIG